MHLYLNTYKAKGANHPSNVFQCICSIAKKQECVRLRSKISPYHHDKQRIVCLQVAWTHFSASHFVPGNPLMTREHPPVDMKTPCGRKGCVPERHSWLTVSHNLPFLPWCSYTCCCGARIKGTGAVLWAGRRTDTPLFWFQRYKTFV